MVSRCACKVGLCSLVLTGALGLFLKVAGAGRNKDCELKTSPTFCSCFEGLEWLQ